MCIKTQEFQEYDSYKMPSLEKPNWLALVDIMCSILKKSDIPEIWLNVDE